MTKEGSEDGPCRPENTIMSGLSLFFEPLILFLRQLLCFRFCWIKALSAYSCHCRAKGCRIEGDSSHKWNGRRTGEPIPTGPARVKPQCTLPGSHHTGQRRSPNSGWGGGDSRIYSCPGLENLRMSPSVLIESTKAVRPEEHSIKTRGDIKFQPRAGNYFPYMRRFDVIHTDVIDLRGAEKHRDV